DLEGAAAVPVDARLAEEQQTADRARRDRHGGLVRSPHRLRLARGGWRQRRGVAGAVVVTEARWGGRRRGGWDRSGNQFPPPGAVSGLMGGKVACPLRRRH